MKFKLKHVVEDTDRHGNVRLYYRRNGSKTRLRGPIGSPDFLNDYKAAANPKTPRVPHAANPGSTKAGSFKWLCAQYYKSSMWVELGPKTQKTRRSIIERFSQHKNSGDKPFALMLPIHIRKRRDEMMATPEAANSMVKVLRQLFRFAIRYDHHDANPATTVELLRSNSSGYHSWTSEEIEKYEMTHPVGSTARSPWHSTPRNAALM